MIPFNKPYLGGKELEYIRQAVASGKISGDGVYTKKCHAYFEQKYGFGKALLTTSCTDALEMAAILLDIQPGDEVIVPSYTFVSTPNAFVLRGAKIVFADSLPDHPNMDVSKIEALITPKTKAIVPVHYAGHACDMDAIMAIADKHGLFVVEDAAQAIDNYYKGRALGSIGHMAAFSFHETKNIIAGEGGMLTINDARFFQRAEIIREKGTNRSQFFRGEVDKYGWVDVGSSFLPSDIIAAYLYAQLEMLDTIQARRRQIWDTYFELFEELEILGFIQRPKVPAYSTNNAHMFYIVCRSIEERTGLMEFLKEKKIGAVFHYLSLHKSPFYQDKHDGRALPYADHYTDCLLRLPLYYELVTPEKMFIIEQVKAYFAQLA
ncbi:MAG: dTDP-4-amino-4,6-dideoxygalactose transaminase [Chitinophagaceae bacterium]